MSRAEPLSVLRQEMLGAEDFEGEVVQGQEVAVFGYQVLGSGPFGVSSDEGIAALEAQGFVFGSKLEGDFPILVNGHAERFEKVSEIAEAPWGDIAADFLDYGPRNLDLVFLGVGDNLAEKGLAGWLAFVAVGEKELVGIKDELQVFRSKSLPAFS